MKYNSGGFTPPEIKAKIVTGILIGIFLILIVLIFGGLILFAYIGKIEINFEIIISIIAVIISLSTILFTFLDRLYKKYFSTKKTIDLNIELLSDSVICWGSISNLGHKRILNKNVYLIVSKGVLENGLYDFGLPLEHEDDEGNISHKEDFCIYAKIMHLCDIDRCCSCKKDLDLLIPQENFSERTKKIITRYNQQVANQTFHRLFVFKGLSKESRLFVDAGEEFSDEIVLKLKDGVYRAMMVWIPEGKEDCACSVKYFEVKTNKKTAGGKNV